jgi:hypothetical protein
MVAALTLLQLGATDRSLLLYDTYTGMPEPEERDVGFEGTPAAEEWAAGQRESHNEWLYAPLSDVRRNLLSTGYPENKLRFVEGKVEDTLPGTAPDRIAILRLDTDLYQSTRHEMIHLYPRLSRHGVLIVDDYGSWRGAKEAVDEILTDQKARILLQKVDPSARMGVKL